MNMLTLKEFAAGAWKVACYDRYKPSTRKRMDSALKSQLLPVFGHQLLDRISQTCVHQWFDEYSCSAPAGANRALDILRQMLNFAITCGYLSNNPASSVKRNRRVEKTRFLSIAEINRLRVALDAHKSKGSGQQQADIIQLLLLTGCRKSEIIQLRWSEVDGNILQLVDSKTGARTVLLNRHAQRIIARQPKSESIYVFPDLTNPSQCRSNELSLWRKVRRQVGIDDVRLHDLRHTFASHAVMRRIPLPVVSRLLGHRSARMTIRYAHVSDDETQKAAQRIGIALKAVLEGRDLGFIENRIATHEIQTESTCSTIQGITRAHCNTLCYTENSSPQHKIVAMDSCAISEYEPDRPADLLKKHIGQKGWSVTETAKRLGFSRQTLSRILNQRIGISPTMALALERIGWSDARYWVCTQALHRLDVVRSKMKRKSKIEKKV